MVDHNSPPEITRSKLMVELFIKVGTWPLFIDHQGSKITPLKAMVIDYGDRGCIEVKGRLAASFGEMRTVRLRLYGYTDKDYEPPPEWLCQMIRNAGYLGPIERIAK